MSLNKRLMTIATEIRVVEIKNENLKKDNDDLKLKLETSEKEYEDHLSLMNMEFTTQKNNFEAIIENLQMELEELNKELEIYKVILFSLGFQKFCNFFKFCKIFKI